MGTTLREVVYDIGGGIPDGKKLRLHRQADRQEDVTCKPYRCPD
jgi:NADH:ubiquinone oxidoreductase subunit F (NADH-binding)